MSVSNVSRNGTVIQSVLVSRVSAALIRYFNNSMYVKSVTAYKPRSKVRVVKVALWASFHSMLPS